MKIKSDNMCSDGVRFLDDEGNDIKGLEVRRLELVMEPNEPVIATLEVYVKETDIFVDKDYVYEVYTDPK